MNIGFPNSYSIDNNDGSGIETAVCTQKRAKDESQLALAHCRSRWVANLVFVIFQLLLFVSLGRSGLHVWGTVAILALASINHFVRRELKLRAGLHTILLVLLGGYYLVAGVSRLGGPQSLLFVFACFSQYLLLAQGLELLRERNASTNYLPGLGTLAILMLMLSLDFILSSSVLNSLYLAFCTLLFINLRPDVFGLLRDGRQMRRKFVILILLLLAAMGIGNVFQADISQGLPQLRALFAGIGNPNGEDLLRLDTNAEFVVQVGLNSIADAKRVDPDELVFGVEASTPPGYMRTLSFFDFDGQSWSNGPGGGEQLAEPLKFLPAERTREPGANRVSMVSRVSKVDLASIYDPNTTYDLAENTIVVEVPVGTGALVPLPINSSAVYGQTRDIRGMALDAHGNAVRASLTNTQYCVLPNEDFKRTEATRYLNRLLQLPDNDADYLTDLSDAICGAVSTVGGKCRAVEKFLVENFEYSLEDDPSKDRGSRSPLHAFLEDRKPAHCEYFATAAVLLLRAQDVPCRMSTGYLACEMNDSNDFFIATNSSAHAWAEAYDQSNGRWILVEATPGTEEYIDLHAQNRDSSEQLAQANDRQGIWENATGILDSLWRTVVSYRRLGWLLPICLLVMLLIVRVSRAWWRTENSRVSRQARKADRIARRMGLTREQSETCHQFAARLEQSEKPELIFLAGWYRSFGSFRYRSEFANELPSAPTLKRLRRGRAS